MAHILDGKMVAEKVKREVTETLKANDLHASLAVVLVGDDQASHIYVEHKNKDCDECGIFCRTHWIDGGFNQNFVVNYVQSLARNDDIDGILVQLPLPKHMSAAEVIAEIPPEKDVDCFTTENIGRLYSGDAFLKPCTPAGVMRLLDEYGIPLSRKHCVVLGRSNVVGKPMAQLLLDDGRLLVQVTAAETDALTCTVLRGGVLQSRKSIAAPGLTVPSPTLTEEDLQNLKIAKQCGVTGVMLPFVRGAEDIRTLRRALQDAGADGIRIFAKIENLTGVQALPELLPLVDEVVIARGDLGNAMPLWELPRCQKQLSAACRAAGVPFMVVTQMLDSMCSRAVPTRAEVSDIYNAVLDGAASVMLTGETAAGQYPVQAMEYLVRTARTALS